MKTQGADYVSKTHYCPDCQSKSRLAVRWNGKADECWCPVCKRTDGFRRRESLTAIWKRNPEAVPIEIAEKLERKYGMQPMNETAIVKANENTMMERIEQARWLKSVTPDDRRALAQLSVQYGFDPLMKELVIYEGQPYITVNGLVRMAHRQKMFAGVEDRPMSEVERQQYGYAAPVCWIAKAYRKDWKVPAVGTGKADPKNPFRNNMIEKEHPEWMARSRALRQALKLAFPHFVPFAEMDSAEEQGIDPETGEILDAEPVVEASEGVDFTAPTDLPPGDLGAAPIVEAFDEEAAKVDLRAKIRELAKLAGWKNTLFDTKFEDSYKVSLDNASLDQLVDAHTKMTTAKAERKAS